MNHHTTTSIHTGVQREDRCCVGIFPTKSINRRLFVGCYRPSEAIMANPTDLVTDLIYRTHLLFMKSHISLPHPSESAIWLNPSQPHQFSCLNFSSIDAQEPKPKMYIELEIQPLRCCAREL